MPPLPFQPLPLVRRRESFSHPDWVFEIKYDGFRALAYLERDRVRLVSRNSNDFASFTPLCEEIARSLRVTEAILDGEIVCLDKNGYSQFNQLLFRRGNPQFCAFDLLWLNGRDVRDLPLVERKRALCNILPKNSPHLLYVDHIENNGEAFFQLACQRDLEGVVAKHRHSRYSTEKGNPNWIKIKNTHYSQIIGRDELFERDEINHNGWAACDRACVAAQRLGDLRE